MNKNQWAIDLNRHSTGENIQIANRHVERCSISLVIREMEVKAIMRCHDTAIRKTKTVRTVTTTDGPYQVLVGMCGNWNSHAWLGWLLSGTALLESSLAVCFKVIDVLHMT